MAEKFLVAGLGNPGKRYVQTRHNVGFMAVDLLAEQLRISFKAGKGDYLVSEVARASDAEKEVILLKPLTFMNNSGVAVRHAMDYFKIDLDKLLLILDEFQLPFGKLRLRPQGSDGGHNGLASVIQHLGSQDFSRLRIGIGSETKGDSADFVLSRFSKSEQEELPALIARAAEAALEFIRYDLPRAMNKFN
ncbi:MAG: aminoacyl-tRNA hydrolase [bacterium]